MHCFEIIIYIFKFWEEFYKLFRIEYALNDTFMHQTLNIYH